MRIWKHSMRNQRASEQKASARKTWQKMKEWGEMSGWANLGAPQARQVSIPHIDPSFRSLFSISLFDLSFPSFTSLLSFRLILFALLPLPLPAGDESDKPPLFQAGLATSSFYFSFCLWNLCAMARASSSESKDFTWGNSVRGL